MSRGDWSFLENLLEEGQEYSTGIGRVWLTVLFLFRMLVLGASAESAWDDEQANFVCNTHQPGCTNVCYDKAFPISHFRYFVLQVIFVSTPTIFYFGYVALRVRKSKKEAERGSDGGQRGGLVKETDINFATKYNSEEKKLEEVRKSRKADKEPPEAPKLKGRLLCAYALSILLKVLLEVGFMLGLYFLYNGFSIPEKYECHWNPCPHTVDCFVSRPTEKTIFVFYTQAISGFSLLLNLLELLHLLQLAITHRLEKHYHGCHGDYLPPTEQGALEPARIQMEASPSRKTGSDANLPTQCETECFTNPCEGYGEPVIEGNWGSGETASDLLPSYVTCVGAARTMRSPRVHYKKNTGHTLKTTKAAQKGHVKQKHYV